MVCSIFLLDQHEGDRERVVHALRRVAPGCYDFHEFGDAAAFSRAVSTNRPDVLIVDVEMPRGLALLEGLRSADGPDVPVLALAELDDNHPDVVAFLQAGAHHYLSKQRLTGPLLHQALAHARSSHRLQRDLLVRQRELEAMTRELRLKDQAKLHYVASASHDLRTPVAGMMGLLSVLGKTRLDEDQRHLLGSLKDCCESLLTCVDDVIDKARIEAGQLEIRRLPFALPDQVASCLAPLRLLAQDKGLALTCELHPRLPRFVVGDPGRLRQLLSNLVSNAIKFTPSGSIRVSVAPVDNQKVYFEVSDTGVGIGPEDLARLFEAHYQAGSRASGCLGSGLGLSITSSLVRCMGGEIGARSQLGVGSSFWLELPLPTTGRESADAEPPPTPARRLSLLVAEDNPIVARVLLAQLTESGHEVTLARNGCEAVQACEEQEFDAVIMDCQMPLLDGYQATRAIRKLPGHQRTPIIALTAQAFTGEKQKCLNAGMSDYLVKPVTPAELQSCLDQHTLRPLAQNLNSAFTTEQAAFEFNQQDQDLGELV